MNPDTPISNDDDGSRHEEIARRAYFLWEDYGRPEGCDLDIWLTAEATMPVPRDSNDDAVELDDTLPFELSEAFSPGAGQPEPLPPSMPTQTGQPGRMPARHAS